MRDRSNCKRGASMALLVAGVMSASAGAAVAEEQKPDLPLWELRLGGSALYAPDYPGAEDYQTRGIGAPIFIYRGERLRIGGDDPTAIARAIAVDEPRFEFDLSLNAAYPADSEDGEAREGMTDLDTQLEIGPQATFNLFDTGWTEEGRKRLRFLLPVRAVGATDFSDFEELGYTVQPTLTWRRQYPGDRQTSYSASLTAVWASEGVQDYYYEVEPEFATPTRAAYDAEGGYLGTHINISGRREIRPNLHLFLTYQARYLGGAVNEDSPLLREDLTHAVSFSFVWTALSSSRPARDRE